ncbi:uncharacterized protein LOC108585462 [Papio anubis]|uniref:uncharacterized protein LOC108585462 n=1 Tax=Papio anubis TaxID=9555 RepID=UPI0012AEB1DC|nr:uncharacterized protein LOC108585462 [Papio anubis]
MLSGLRAVALGVEGSAGAAEAGKLRTGLFAGHSALHGRSVNGDYSIEPSSCEEQKRSRIVKHLDFPVVKMCSNFQHAATSVRSLPLEETSCHFVRILIVLWRHVLHMAKASCQQPSLTCQA